MSNEELTAVFLILLLLVGLAHLLGYLFVKLRQPKVVGEILALRRDRCYRAGCRSFTTPCTRTSWTCDRSVGCVERGPCGRFNAS